MAGAVLARAPVARTVISEGVVSSIGGRAMYKDNKGLIFNVIRRAREILFSLNVSFVVVSVVELAAHRVVAPFFCWILR